MKIVAGGPAAVSVKLITPPDNTTVNGLESLPPTCTVPEKFSVVTAAAVGAVDAADVLVESVLVEHAAVPSARAHAAMRPRMYCFTALH
jgi:hypothetical protein